MKKYYLRIPEKVLTLLPEWEKEPPFKNFRIEQAKVLLSIIATHYQKTDRGNYFAQLKLEYLRNRVYNAERYLRYFITAGVIKHFGGFIPGEQSYRYQFTEKYFSPYQKIELTDAKLKNKLLARNSADGRKTSRKYPNQKAILKQIEVNADNAERIARKRSKGIDELNNTLGAITRIENKDLTFSVDDKVFRLHTNLTGFPKSVRGELTIAGKKLSGIDICNSVPYMANKILSDPESVRQFFPEPDKYPSMRLKCLRLSEQQDVKQYALLTSKAKFYSYLVDEFNKHGFNYEIVTEAGKRKLKAKVFQILFSSNRYSCKEKKIFQECFPGVGKAFSLLRMYRRNYFNYTLGRLESHIVLDVILDHLNKHYPELFATQIYDNVITAVSDSTDIVAGIMTEKLTGFVGVTPSLKTEIFSTDSDFSPENSLRTRKRKKEGRGADCSHTVLKVLENVEVQQDS